MGALYTAIGLLALDAILTVAFAAEAGTNPITGIFLRIFFILILWKGVPAVKQIKAERQQLEQETFDYV